MYNLELWDKDLTGMVSLGTAPVDTLREAKIYALAKIRRRCSMATRTLHRYSGNVYGVRAGDKCAGFLKIVKV